MPEAAITSSAFGDAYVGHFGFIEVGGPFNGEIFHCINLAVWSQVFIKVRLKRFSGGASSGEQWVHLSV
jgi:hypothetical protein